MNNEEDYWNGYLLGFIAGEGCFHISIMDQRKNSWKIKRKNKLKFEIKPVFLIVLSDEDIESLEFVKNRFGVGYISLLKKDSDSNLLIQKQFFISGLKGCKIVRDLIDKYEFMGRKGKDYSLWKEAINLIENKEHLTKEGILKIARIRDQMNKVGKTGKPKNYRDYNWFKESLS
jgi:hypothetical protein